MPPSEKKIKNRIKKAKAKAKAKPKRQKQRQTQTQKVIQTVKISGAGGAVRQQNPVLPIQIHQPTAPIYHPSPHQHPKQCRSKLLFGRHLQENYRHNPTYDLY
jgi:hypothetical protein